MGSHMAFCTTSAAELRVTGGGVQISVGSVRSRPGQGNIYIYIYILYIYIYTYIYIEIYTIGPLKGIEVRDFI